MTDSPLLFEIKGNALDDGPGIRTVVFFKGCPLSCVWCHNPEGRDPGPNIAFETAVCVACDTCIGACPDSALDRRNPFFIDRERCSLCFACVETCPSGALSRVGRHRTIDEVVESIRRDLPFFRNSGGGVTLSGGEPTEFMDYAAALARSLRELGVHVLLETCGLFDLRRFRERLYPHLDQIYCDLKFVDPAAHRRYCGAPNDRILANVAALHREAESGGVPILVRVPLVPGLTAVDENLAAMAALLRSYGIRRLALLPYNPLWSSKMARLGRRMPAVPGVDFERWMSAEDLARCRAHFEGFELAAGS